MRIAPLALLLAACVEPDAPGIVALQPEISVVPDEVAFGERTVPLTHEELVFVSNAGRIDLEVALSLEGDDAGVFELTLPTATIEPGSDLPVPVRFRPTTFLDYAATLVITSNDEDDARLELPVTGTGVAAPLPDIQLSASSLDFGTVDVDDTAQAFVILSNVGAAPLTLGDVSLAGSGAFDLPANPRNNTLAPGNTLPLLVTYAPTRDGGDSGVITIASDDPDEGAVEVVLLGNGGADYEYPVAVIDCPGVVNPPTVVRLDGADSYDPRFEPADPAYHDLDHRWTLLAVPTDLTSGAPISDASITNVVGPFTDLRVDAVGTYLVSLVVENDVGIRSAATVCQVEAIPQEDLLVELTWSTSNADLDLHLAQAGAALFEEPGDASWCNRRPAWGAAGTGDDPSLNLDDRAGHGPENFSIASPADGMYDVRVHYFEDQGDDIVQATVRVYVRGELAPGFPQSQLLRRNEAWDVARVNWPAGTVALLSVPVYEAEHRQCFTP